MFKVWFCGYYRCSRICQSNNHGTVLWEILIGLLEKSGNKVKFHSERKSHGRNKTWESDFSGHYGQLRPENFLWPIILMSLRARNFWQMVRWTKTGLGFERAQGSEGDFVVEWLLLLSKVRGSIPIGFSVRTLIYRLYFSSDVSKAGRGQELAHI